VERANQLSILTHDTEPERSSRSVPACALARDRDQRVTPLSTSNVGTWPCYFNAAFLLHLRANRLLHPPIPKAERPREISARRPRPNHLGGLAVHRPGPRWLRWPGDRPWWAAFAAAGSVVIGHESYTSKSTFHPARRQSHGWGLVSPPIFVRPWTWGMVSAPRCSASFQPPRLFGHHRSRPRAVPTRSSG